MGFWLEWCSRERIVLRGGFSLEAVRLVRVGFEVLGLGDLVRLGIYRDFGKGL